MRIKVHAGYFRAYEDRRGKWCQSSTKNLMIATPIPAQSFWYVWGASSPRSPKPLALSSFPVPFSSWFRPQRQNKRRQLMPVRYYQQKKPCSLYDVVSILPISIPALTLCASSYPSGRIWSRSNSYAMVTSQISWPWAPPSVPTSSQR